jgi:histidinol-phosphate aminotransferase
MAIRSSLNQLKAYVPGEQPASPTVLKLNTNENPYPPSPRVMEALIAVSAEDLRKYPDPSGTRLRKALADYHGCSPDQILLVNGSDEGLALCTRCFCEHGGSVGYISPSYSLYPVLADIAELQKTEFPLNDDFSWEVPEVVEVDLFFLTRPNAPTGLSLPADELEKLFQVTRGVVVVDEAYAAFSDEGGMGEVGRYPNVLISRTFSKSHSLAGVRVGYLAGPSDLISALHKIRDSYNLDAVAQRLALASLEDSAYTQEVLGKIRTTRERTRQRLQQMGFEVPASDTNFLFARVPEGTQAEALFQTLKEREMFIRYFPGDLTGDFLRITVGTDEQMDRFLSALQEIL